MIVGEAKSITPKELEKNTQFLWLGLHVKRRKAIDQFLIKKCYPKLLDERPNGSLKQAS